MFKLLRRISSSVYPRPDRPWGDDATSNAPTIGKRRRTSDDDEDMHDVNTTRKRRGQLSRENTDASELGEFGARPKEADPAVKEVTKGVKEVDLDDQPKGEGEAKKDDEEFKDADVTEGVEVKGDETEAASKAGPEEKEAVEKNAAVETEVPAVGSSDVQDESAPKFDASDAESKETIVEPAKVPLPDDILSDSDEQTIAAPIPTAEKNTDTKVVEEFEETTPSSQ